MRSVMIGLVAVLLASTAWGQNEYQNKYLKELVFRRDTTNEVLAEKLKGKPNLERLWPRKELQLSR